MHLILLTTFSKEKASNSLEARKYVTDYLARTMEMEVNTNGEPDGDPWISCKGIWTVNWFRVGSWRSSGLLTGLRPKLWETLQDGGLAMTLAETLRSWGLSEQQIQERDDVDSCLTLNVSKNDPRIQEIWERLGGTGTQPFIADEDEFGPDYDAMLVTEDLYTRVLKQYEGECKTDGDTDRCCFADLEDEIVSRDFIGNKWIVVVDGMC